MNIFLFVTAFIVSIILNSYYCIEITDAFETNPKLKKLKKHRSMINSSAVGITVFLISIAVCDGLGIIGFGAFAGAYVLMGFVSFVSFLLYLFSKKRKSDIIAFASKTLIIVSILELTLFNAPVYRMWFGDYKMITFKASEDIIESGAYFNDEATEVIMLPESKEIVLDFPGLDRKVSSVYVELTFSDEARAVNVALDATDEAQMTVLREDIATGTIANGKQNSQFMYCDLSGKVGDAKVRISPHNRRTVYIKGISFNMPAPMEISWIRFLLIVIFSVFFRAFLKGKYLQKSMEENLRVCRIATAVITAGACISAFMIVNHKLDGRKWSDELKQTEGNQVTQQLVEAFENGRTYLIPEPDETLKGFDNLYDTGKRDQEIVSKYSDYYENIWDHVFYNGKFYSYYGIAPVILLCLPYHLITGYFIPECAAVLVFSVIGFIGLAFLFLEFVRKLYPKLPTGLYILSYIIIQTVCGVWYSVGRPLFYEIAMSAGFAFMTWAVYFLISSNVVGKGKISLPKTALASLFFAIAVLSRPTTVLYCICAAVFMVAAAPRFSENAESGIKKVKFADYVSKKTVPYLLCALVPMAVLGLVQMIYNASRFGSPFEFGIQYSLTINNFTKTEYHWRLSLIPLYNYLFSAPIFSSEYPFVSAKFQNMGINGFFYEDFFSTYVTSGIFFHALPMFAYFLSGKALKYIPDSRERLKKCLYVGVPCVVIPLAIIASVWESGYAIRYMADFAWQMLLGAYAIIFFIYLKTKNETVKRMFRVFFCFSLVWTLYVSGNQIMEQALRYGDMHWDYPEIAYEIEKIFAFWK